MTVVNQCEIRNFPFREAPKAMNGKGNLKNSPGIQLEQSKNLLISQSGIVLLLEKSSQKLVRLRSDQQEIHPCEYIRVQE